MSCSQSSPYFSLYYLCDLLLLRFVPLCPPLSTFPSLFLYLSGPVVQRHLPLRVHEQTRPFRRAIRMRPVSPCTVCARVRSPLHFFQTECLLFSTASARRKKNGIAKHASDAGWILEFRGTEILRQSNTRRDFIYSGSLEKGRGSKFEAELRRNLSLEKVRSRGAGKAQLPSPRKRKSKDKRCTHESLAASPKRYTIVGCRRVRVKGHKKVAPTSLRTQQTEQRGNSLAHGNPEKRARTKIVSFHPPTNVRGTEP